MSRVEPPAPGSRAGSGRRIFIGYARKDERAVESLVAELSNAGHEVWLDQALTGGQDWWAAILGRIRDCQIFLIVVSDASVASAACDAETQYAAAYGGRSCRSW